MKRRDFLKHTSATSAPFFFNGLGLSPMSRPWFLDSLDEESDRVLVLIRLSGGNDGLHTVIPLDQYDRLYQARSNIIIPESEILSVTDSVGFHPEMGGLRDLFEEGRLGIVQSVGYPNQNRSHFKSMQIWYSGSPEAGFESTGWLGRFLDERYPGFPDNYPNGQYPDPFAVSMGDFVSETCQGQAANFSIALNDPFSLEDLTEWAGDDFSGTRYGEELAFLRRTIAESNSYYERIGTAAENASNQVDYPDTSLGAYLKTVALLIAGGLQTKIYTVNLSGFDTHALQVENNDTTVGRHATLLRTVSDALHAFQQDLVQLGLAQRVIGMTFSEFGRQIRSNGSLGTDHGTAAPLFLFGECVNPQILGDNPAIPEEVGVQEGVAMQYDFRDVYGSVLVDWFGMEETIVQGIFSHEFQYLPIVNGCQSTAATPAPAAQREITTHHYPNPFRTQTTITFRSDDEWVRLSVFDALGHEIKVLFSGKVKAGEHQVQFDGRDLPAGNYYYRLVMEGRQKTTAMVKV